MACNTILMLPLRLLTLQVCAFLAIGMVNQLQSICVKGMMLVVNFLYCLRGHGHVNVRFAGMITCICGHGMMVSTGIGMKKCCLTSRMTLTNKTISFLQQTLMLPTEGRCFQIGLRHNWKGVIALLTLWKLFLRKADHSTQEATYLNT